MIPQRVLVNFQTTTRTKLINKKVVIINDTRNDNPIPSYARTRTRSHIERLSPKSEEPSHYTHVKSTWEA